jgi:hypothetical protein
VCRIFLSSPAVILLSQGVALAQILFPAGSALIVSRETGKQRWTESSSNLGKSPLLAFTETVEEAASAVERSVDAPAVLILNLEQVPDEQEVVRLRERIRHVPLVLVHTGRLPDSLCEFFNSCVAVDGGADEQSEQLQFVLNYWLNVNRPCPVRR